MAITLFEAEVTVYIRTQDFEEQSYLEIELRPDERNQYASFQAVNSAWHQRRKPVSGLLKYVHCLEW